MRRAARRDRTMRLPSATPQDSAMHQRPIAIKLYEFVPERKQQPQPPPRSGKTLPKEPPAVTFSNVLPQKSHGRQAFRSPPLRLERLPTPHSRLGLDDDDNNDNNNDDDNDGRDDDNDMNGVAAKKENGEGTGNSTRGSSTRGSMAVSENSSTSGEIPLPTPTVQVAGEENGKKESVASSIELKEAVSRGLSYTDDRKVSVSSLDAALVKLVQEQPPPPPPAAAADSEKHRKESTISIVVEPGAVTTTGGAEDSQLLAPIPETESILPQPDVDIDSCAEDKYIREKGETRALFSASAS